MTPAPYHRTRNAFAARALPAVVLAVTAIYVLTALPGAIAKARYDAAVERIPMEDER